jgi:death-on-curing protein
LAYGQPSIADLAAAYAFGIVRNHPFVDGNKRVALVVTELFLDLNGHELLADDTDCVLTWRALADGELPERDLSTWISERLA